MGTIDEKDILENNRFVWSFKQLQHPQSDGKKLFIVLKRTAKFFISLLEKIEREENV